MSQGKAEEPADAKPAKGGRSGLLIVLVALVAAGVGVAGALLLLPRLRPPADVAALVEPQAHSASARDVEGSFSERLVQLDPFVVNVSGEGYPRYLKVQVAFELDSAAGKAGLEERIAQIRDLTILLLSSKRLTDVTDFEGKALLKDELREQANQVLSEGRIESVLFTEFVVQ